jgi:hypothetical protein
MNASPDAAIGVKIVMTFIAHGRIKPMAPNDSDIPINRTVDKENLSAQVIVFTNLSIGRVDFITPANANIEARMP